MEKERNQWRTRYNHVTGDYQLETSYPRQDKFSKLNRFKKCMKHHLFETNYVDQNDS